MAKLKLIKNFKKIINYKTFSKHNNTTIQLLRITKTNQT